MQRPESMPSPSRRSVSGCRACVGVWGARTAASALALIDANLLLASNSTIRYDDHRAVPGIFQRNLSEGN